MKIIIETIAATIIASTIVGLIISIVSWTLAKRTLKSEKEQIFTEIPDKIVAYLSTPEAQQNLRNVGIIMASGIVKQFGLGDAPLKGKTWGIPNVVFVPFAKRLLGKIDKKPISEEPQDTTSDSFG